MRPIFNHKNAATLLLLIFGVVFIFHLLILLGIISSQDIWGGQIPNDLLIYFELVALVVLLLFSWFIASKVGFLKWKAPFFVIRFGPWIVFTYLLLNTIGNLIGTNQEKLFAIATFLLTICAFMVAIKK